MHAESFFSRQLQGFQEPTQCWAGHLDAIRSQPEAKLLKRDVVLGRDDRADQCRMRCQDRLPPSAILIRRNRAPVPPSLHQLHHKTDADIKLRSNGVARGAGLNRADNPFPKVPTIRARPPSLASSIQRLAWIRSRATLE